MAGAFLFMGVGTILPPTACLAFLIPSHKEFLPTSLALDFNDLFTFFPLAVSPSNDNTSFPNIFTASLINGNVVSKRPLNM